MKTINYTLALLILMVSFAIASCSPRKGELRDRNLEQATLARLDSVPGIQYVGKSYARELDGDKFQTVIYAMSLILPATALNIMRVSLPMMTAQRFIPGRKWTPMSSVMSSKR